MPHHEQHGIGGALHRVVKQLTFAHRYSTKHVIGTAFFAGGFAHTDAHPHEVLRLEVLGDRAQTVVAR